MIKASIDIGSNSILLLAGEFKERFFIEKLNLSEVAALGKGIDASKKFSEESMQKALSILQNYTHILKEHSILPSEVLVTATEASRVVTNAQEFFEKVKSLTGLEVQIISGEQEAYYAGLGVSLGNNKEIESIVLDIGGASTEIIHIQNNPYKVLKSVSLPLGSVRALEWLSQKTFSAQTANIEKNFTSFFPKYTTNKITAIAGTMTAIATIMQERTIYSDQAVQGFIFTIDDLQKFIQQFEGWSTDKILSTYSFLGKRAETLLSGAKVALWFAKHLEIKEFEVSTYGLRYGTLFSKKVTI
ncbi:MAG: hypothetical protein KBD63_03490 [Bacteriovoracaceae bacterium]|nr:hypothetical protein [Bacteriovoracaceae bacterium]